MSRARSIDEMCKQCIYDPGAGNGTWRQQTEACTSKACPLYKYRPMSYKEIEDETKEEACS